MVTAPGSIILSRSVVVFSNAGGTVTVPPAGHLLIDRGDGGQLVVHPPRPVWERGELALDELTRWSCLVAATGWAMLDVLPQLAGGCVNYWEAGNWALNADAYPPGDKTPVAYRRVHAHVIGRSVTAAHPSWSWGEAPAFPRYQDRERWSAAFMPLTPAECAAIAERVAFRLRTAYGFEEPVRS